MTQSGGMGLPADFLGQLGADLSSPISLAKCNRAALDGWRSCQRQLTHLDAEISALRNALEMGSHPHLRVSKVTLRTEENALENRAFEASDGVLTEDLEGMVGDGLASETDTYSASDVPTEAAAHDDGNVSNRSALRMRREGQRPGSTNRRPGQRRRRR